MIFFRPCLMRSGIAYHWEGQNLEKQYGHLKSSTVQNLCVKEIYLRFEHLVFIDALDGQHSVIPH